MTDDQKLTALERKNMAKAIAKNNITIEQVNKLISRLEESARATRSHTTRFIEPAIGTLSKAENRRSHLIFGRRGSGKSSLLNKVASQLSLARRPNVTIDLETFKGHSYPDVLISILIDVFTGFEKWLAEEGVASSSQSLWKRFLGKPSRKPLNKKQVGDLKEKIKQNIDTLKLALYSADESDKRDSVKTSEIGERSSSAGVGGSTQIPISANIAERKTTNNENAEETHYKYRKIEIITQKILDFQSIFKTMKDVSGGEAFLLLDDLYYIRKEDQHKVIDFFHRIAKQNGLILKIGTIRHRSQWYIHGNPPIGLKIGDDCDEINLDLSLDQFDSTKRFLSEILQGIVIEETSIHINKIVTDGCIERLCLASGGVARDFLGIFKKACEISRAEIADGSGFVVSVEHINQAAGDYDTNKREELKLDTFEDRTYLEDLFGEICKFCIDDVNCNVFLIPKDSPEMKVKKIQELVDLRLIHFIDARVTLKRSPGRIYEAYMLDVSQYSGSRKRRGFKLIEFWKPSGKDELRKSNLLLKLDGIDIS